MSCDETRSGWHNGWLIFTDAAGDGLLNASDQLITRVPVQSDAVSILWNNGDGLQFNSRGQRAPGQALFRFALTKKAVAPKPLSSAWRAGCVLRRERFAVDGENRQASIPVGF